MVEVRSRNNTPQTESFWELHRRLGECYESEISQLRCFSSALLHRTSLAGERLPGPEEFQRLTSNPNVYDEGSVISEPSDRRARMSPQSEADVKKQSQGSDSEKSQSGPRSPRPRTSRAGRVSSIKSLHVPSRDASMPLGDRSPEDFQRRPPNPNEEAGESSESRRRRPSWQMDAVTHKKSASSLERSSPPSPLSPKRATVSLKSERASSAKSLHLPLQDINLPSPPLDHPTFMDSPTRDKSGTSVGFQHPLLTRGEASKGSGELCAEDLVPRSTWLKRGIKSVPKALAKKSTMFSVEEISTTPYASEVIEEKVRLLHPGGRVRTFWDVLTVLWLLHDIVLIPLQFFDLPESEFLDFLSWSTIAFWSIDIVMSFCTGTYSKGVLVMDALVVARKYVRTWFPVDIMLVSLDWVALAVEGTGGNQGHNVLWILRLLRLVRVVRLGKMSRTAMVLQEAMQGWAVNVQYSLAMNIIRLLLLNHMVACAWWGFSHIGGHAEGWSTRYGVEYQGTLYGYASSLHWAIAQLGVGSTEIEATNAPERIFSIFVALLSLITFSTMVSSMTSMMTSYYRSKEEETRLFSQLQRYLLHNSISTDLCQRITKFLQHAYMAQHQASSQDMHVPLLEMLSRPLMCELQLEKHHNSMLAMPFLGAVLKWHNVQTLDMMRTLASCAFSTCTVASKDVIFCCGVEAVTAYLPISGAVSYLQETRPAEECLHVWTAEMCLWTEWFFVGDLIATDVSRILILDMNSFCQTISSNPLTHSLAVQYAQEYTNMLRSEAEHVEMSDIWQMPSEPEVHDLMAGHGFAPELVFNTFGRRRAKGRQSSHVGGLAGLSGMARMQVVPDQILE